MERAERCPHCGAKMVVYHHGLTQGLVVSLAALMRAGGCANIDRIGLTSNQRNNFQKLRYWGLAERTDQAGVWKVPELGYRFMTGQNSVPQMMKTYRGKVVGSEGVWVWVHDFPELVSHQDINDFRAMRENKGAEWTGLLFPCQ